jgi:hypothetical protein
MKLIMQVPVTVISKTYQRTFRPNKKNWSTGNIPIPKRDLKKLTQVDFYTATVYHGSKLISNKTYSFAQLQKAYDQGPTYQYVIFKY